MCILIYFLDDISTDMNLDLNIMVPSYPSPVCIKITDTVSSMELLSCSPISIYLTVKLWCVHCTHVICESSVISPQNTEALHTEIICVSVNSQNTKPWSTTPNERCWAQVDTREWGLCAVCARLQPPPDWRHRHWSPHLPAPARRQHPRHLVTVH